MRYRVMRKILMISVLTLVAVAQVACSQKQEFSEGILAVNGWCNAVKNLDYGRYCEYALSVKDAEQFVNMYQEYYFDRLTVTDFDKEEREISDPSGEGTVKARSIRFDAVTIDRKTRSVRGNIYADFELVRKNSSEQWKVASKTIIHRN